MIASSLFACGPVVTWERFHDPVLLRPAELASPIQVIAPHMDLLRPSCSLGIMPMPSHYRYEPRPVSHIDDIIGELDSRIQGKREHAKSLKDSDAPPSAIAGVEKEIDNLTGQLLTIIDHSKSIT
jgi:hypothetical protein